MTIRFAPSRKGTPGAVRRGSALVLRAAFCASFGTVIAFSCEAASARTCVELSKTCADTADRVVNGETISRECWKWEKTLSCVDESPAKNQCDPGVIPSTCSVTAEKCAATDASHGCLETLSDLLCTEKPSGPGITPEDPRITIAWNTVEKPGLPLGDGCVVSARTCLDSDPREIPVENLPGETATASPACWEEVLTISCPSQSEAESCEKLEAAGCTLETEKTCDRRDDAGRCISWSAAYVCKGVAIEGDGIIEGESTDIPDGEIVEDESECREKLEAESLSGLSCEPLRRTCTKPGRTEVIDGVEVTLPCSEWLAEFVCRAEGENGCEVLESLALSGICKPESEPVCESESADGGCLRWKSVYRCGKTEGPGNSEDAGGAELLPPVEDSEVSPFDACGDLRADATCVETAKTCLEGPGIKMVNGEPVYRDCWKWSHSFTCRMAGEGECGDYEKNPSCRLVSEACPGGGTECPRPTRVYECVTEGSTSAAGTVCSGEACIADVCAPTDDKPDEDFANTLVEMEIAREAGIYGDVSGNRFFSGIALGCRDRKAAKSCCRTEPEVGASNSAFSLYLSFGAGSGMEAIKFVGSPYVYDVLAYSDSTSGLLTKLYGSAPNGVYEPSFSFWGATASWTQTGGWSFNFSPSGFALAAAMHFYQGYASCRAEDQRVAMMKGARLCKYLGTVCTNTTPGLGCTEAEERYVCFNSRLARILNEQGRSQLGRGWGTPLEPDLRGFTAEELGSLDFSRMDLSEFVADVVREAMKSGNAVSDASLARAQERVADMLSGKLAHYSAMPGSTGVSRTGTGRTGLRSAGASGGSRSPFNAFMTVPEWQTDVRARTLRSPRVFSPEGFQK